MSLLKELSSISESAGLTEVDRFHKRMKLITDQIRTLGANFKSPTLTSILQELDADMSYLKDVARAFDQFESSFDEMYENVEKSIKRGNHNGK